MKIGSHLFIRPPHFGCTVLRERQRGRSDHQRGLFLQPDGNGRSDEFAVDGQW